jgi:hypothetical protein
MVYIYVCVYVGMMWNVTMHTCTWTKIRTHTWMYVSESTHSYHTWTHKAFNVMVCVYIHTVTHVIKYTWKCCPLHACCLCTYICSINAYTHHCINTALTLIFSTREHQHCSNMVPIKRGLHAYIHLICSCAQAWFHTYMHAYMHTSDLLMCAGMISTVEIEDEAQLQGMCSFVCMHIDVVMRCIHVKELNSRACMP